MECPYCGTSLAEGVPTCRSCGASLFDSCRQCGAAVSVVARQCPSCGYVLAAPAAPSGVVAAPAARGPVGPGRNIALIIILPFLTCGIWAIVSLFQFAGDVNAHRGRSDLNPLLDVVLSILTCGLWGFYVMYKYPTVLAEMQQEEGLPPSDLALPCLLLHFFGLGIISLAILQSELNKHWELHGRPAVA